MLPFSPYDFTIFSVSIPNHAYEMSEDFLNFNIGPAAEQPNYDLSLTFRDSFDGKTFTSSFTEDGSDVLDKWFLFAVRLEFQNQESTIRTCVNTRCSNRVGVGEKLIILDELENEHILGAQVNTENGSRVLGHFFHGYIYNFSVSDKDRLTADFSDRVAFSPISNPCTRNENTCGSDNFPSEPTDLENLCPYSITANASDQLYEVCVSTCLPDQFIDEENNDACEACHEDCVVCTNANNCNPCFDE